MEEAAAIRKKHQSGSCCTPKKLCPAAVRHKVGHPPACAQTNLSLPRSRSHRRIKTITTSGCLWFGCEHCSHFSCVMQQFKRGQKSNHNKSNNNAQYTAVNGRNVIPRTSIHARSNNTRGENPEIRAKPASSYGYRTLKHHATGASIRLRTRSTLPLPLQLLMAAPSPESPASAAASGRPSNKPCRRGKGSACQ